MNAEKRKKQTKDCVVWTNEKKLEAEKWKTLNDSDKIKLLQKRKRGYPVNHSQIIKIDIMLEKYLY